MNDTAVRLELLAESARTAHRTLFRWAARQPDDGTGPGDLADALESSHTQLSGTCWFLYPQDSSTPARDQILAARAAMDRWVERFRGARPDSSSAESGALLHEAERIVLLVESLEGTGEWPDAAAPFVIQRTWTNGRRCSCCLSEWQGDVQKAGDEAEARRRFEEVVNETRLGSDAGTLLRWEAVSLADASVIGLIECSWPKEKRERYRQTRVRSRWRGGEVDNFTVNHPSPAGTHP